MLIIDSNLGDFELSALHWLGKDTSTVAASDGLQLLTAEEPAWWSGEKAPATFLLGGATGSAISAESIVWALDAIRESGGEPKTFAVGMGATGLRLREYAEDLAPQKQSERADLVGVGFCGTPHNGYSAMGTYPEQELWEAIAKSIGLPVEDLEPGSAYLKQLNEGSLPAVMKVLNVNGSVGDLGFGLTDGAGTNADLALADSVSNQVVASQASATIAHMLNLTGKWEPFTSSINYSGRSVDAQLTERLSAISSYETSDEVGEIARDFYLSWFDGALPVTHNSNVLLLDLSGSMVEAIDASSDKLAAAKAAAKQYLQAMRECSALPQSPPMDVAVFGFNEVVGAVTEGYDEASAAALDGMVAQNETNIGIALEQALKTLASRPTCADKHILLLSDGESTRGMGDGEMLAGPVAKAAELGIVVDCIGFGDVGESDAGFLDQVASVTGGTYYQANDTYSLKVNFLKSYYSSLGLNLVDEEVAGNSGAATPIGATDDRTSALAIGIVGKSEVPAVKLLRDGSPVDASQYTVKEESGFAAIQYLSPVAGEYSLELSDNPDGSHVFAVRQQGIPRAAAIVGEQADYSLYLLIGAGVLLVIAVVAVVVRSSRKSKRTADASTAQGGGK